MRLPWRSVYPEGHEPPEVPPGLIRHPARPAIYTSLTLAEARKLKELAAGHLVLEIGSAYGFSAIVMSETAEHVFAVDPHDGENSGSLDGMCENLRCYNAEAKVTMMLGRSQDVLRALALASARFGLVFVDGDHREKAVRADLVWAWHLLQETGVLCAHDYLEDSLPGVKAALDAFEHQPDEIVDTLWITRKTTLP